MAEEQNIVKRTIKDSVFCDLFADPENQLKLYQFLHPEDKAVPLSDFTTVTINNVLTDQLYNDLGFTVFSQEEVTRMYGRQLQRQQATETAERMIRAGKLSDTDIADYSGLTLAQAKALREEIKTAVMA